MTSPIQFFIVNAFSSVPFRGNPATVCIVPRNFLSFSEDSQTNFFAKVAAEVSLVETAFVLPPDQPKTDYKLRFFTRRKEMNFCGHATLAAAHILHTEFRFPSDEIYFSTSTGVIVVKVLKNQSLYELDLHPSLPTSLQNVSVDDLKLKLAVALQIRKSLQSGDACADHILDLTFHEGSHNLIVVLANAWNVTQACVNPSKLMESVPPFVSKVTITATPNFTIIPSGSGASDSSEESKEEEKWKRYDFITRLFAPWLGIDEDAVSGASHAILAQYWRRKGKVLKHKLLCFQPSSRGGEVVLTVNGDRVGVSGEATTISRGALVTSRL